MEQQSGPDRQMRMELKLRLGDQTSSLVQVCDGRSLWTKRRLLGEDHLSRIDVARVKQAMQAASDGSVPGNPGLLPGLGGMQKTIAGLLETFDFSSAKRGDWGGRPVWKLQGVWKPQKLLELFPDQRQAVEAGKPLDTTKFPEHLPDRVVVFLLAEDDLFPFRIEYRQRNASQRQADNNVPNNNVPDAAPGRALVTMELSEIDINVRIDPKSFVYTPGDTPVEDRTEAFLEEHGLKP